MKKKLAMQIILFCVISSIFCGCNSDKTIEDRGEREYNPILNELVDQDTVMLTDEEISQINKDGRAVCINKSITIKGNSKIALNVPIVILGGSKVSISNLKFDGENNNQPAITICTAESSLEIHNNAFENYAKSVICIDENRTGLTSETISIYENSFMNWGKSEGVDGAINLDIKDKEYLLIDIQTNRFAQNSDVHEAAFVYNNKNNEENVYENVILNWGDNNQIDDNKGHSTIDSIENKSETSGIGMILQFSGDRQIINSKNTNKISDGVVFTPWNDLVLEEGCILELDGTLVLPEGVTFTNRGDIQIGSNGRIICKDSSQLKGVDLLEGYCFFQEK